MIYTIRDDGTARMTTLIKSSSRQIDAGINWSEEVKKAASKYYNRGYNTHSSLLDKLTNGLLFTSEEAEYSIAQNGFSQ